MTMILRALLLSVALAFTVAADGTYTCIETKASQDLTTSGSATWTRLNCSDTAEPPLLAVNVLVVDLLAKDIKISPGVSKDAAAPLKPVPDLAASNPDRNFIAGINGGYFWRTDITGFWFDDVCR